MMIYVICVTAESHLGVRVLLHDVNKLIFNSNLRFV